eukprot:305279_1
MSTCKLDCSTSSKLSRHVTIVYGVMYSSLLIIVSIYSFHFLMKYNEKFANSSRIKRFKMWFKDVWKRRSCYVPIVAHIFDQITDVSVAIQFYILSQQKSDNDWCQCNGLNVWYLFILTLLSMAIYRAVSAYLIYIATKSV